MKNKSGISCWKYIFLITVLHLTTVELSMSQISPCLDGQQASCKCQTADIICSPDELNGVKLPMSPFRHPQDAPTPLCRGDGAPDNPSWVGFTAWCERFSVRLILDNCSGMCSDRTPCRPGFFPCGIFGGGCSFGVQVALYESCDFSRSVACDVNECRESEIIFNLNDLVPGTTYYFMVDGCSGSACDVTFEVLEFCGKQELPPWEANMTSPDFICLQEDALFTIDTFEFADKYHWFVNDSLVQVSENHNLIYQFDTLGEYNICVDISSGECVLVEDNPEPTCRKIQVFQTNIDSLDIQSDGVCPDIPFFIRTHYVNVGPLIYSHILVTDINDNTLIFTDGDTLTWVPEECGEFKVWAILSDVDSMWDVQSITSATGEKCTSYIMKTVSINDEEGPVFFDPPKDVVLECFLQIPSIDSLRVEDNCSGIFTTEGQEILPQNLCIPGSWVRTWTASDKCGNTTIHSQNITIQDSFPIPQWTQAYPDTTIECKDIPELYNTLMFDNFATDTMCQLKGSIVPQVMEDVNNCKGNIIVLWEYEDLCGRKLTYSQNIVVVCSPDSIPEWSADIEGPELWCGQDTTFFEIDKWDWAEEYHWYINNERVASGTSHVLPVSWDSPGEYMVCLDVSSNNCFNEENNPEPVCQNITVFQVTIDSLVIKTSENCSTEPIFIQLFYERPDTTLFPKIFVLDTLDNFLKHTHADTLTFQPEYCGHYTIVAALSVHDKDISLQDILSVPDSGCDDVIFETVLLSDTISPKFLNTPADLTVECYLQVPEIEVLKVNDNCLGEYSVSGSELTPDALCEPNTWERIWSASDLCGNTTTYIQTISLTDTFPLPEWLEWPSDTTIECTDWPSFYDDLSFQNNASEALCDISGQVAPVVIDNSENCMGNITVIWEYEDLCGRIIRHTQRIFLKEGTPSEFYIPDVFNPLSQDGNSTFFIGSNKTLNIEEFFVWDRWGNKIFQTQNIPTGLPLVGWDGRFQGKIVNSGVYIYSAVIILPNQNKKELRGTVSVLY